MRKVNSSSRASLYTSQAKFHKKSPLPQKKLTSVECIDLALKSGREIKLIRDGEHIATWSV